MSEEKIERCWLFHPETGVGKIYTGANIKSMVGRGYLESPPEKTIPEPSGDPDAELQRANDNLTKLNAELQSQVEGLEEELSSAMQSLEEAEAVIEKLGSQSTGSVDLESGD